MNIESHDRPIYDEGGESKPPVFTITREGNNMGQFEIFKSAIDSDKAGATVTSHEGGKVFRATDGVIFERFLILGTFGTFYADAATLAKAHMHKAQVFMREHPDLAMDILEGVVTQRLAYRRDPYLFALAFLSTPAAPIGIRRRVAALMHDHVITGTDLLHWAAYRKMVGGKWNATTRAIVADWFTRDRDDLALQAVKYQQRDGWSLRDLARLSHPKVDDDSKKAIMEFIVNPEDRGKNTDVALIDAYNDIRIDSMSPLVAASIIRANRLPREAVPTAMLNDADVWDALLDDMPAQAMFRNLGKMTSVGIVDGRMEEIVRKIGLAAHRLHPIQFLVTWYQYAQGRGDKGNLTWHPNPYVVAALETGFDASFGHLDVIENVAPLIALDVSGSMTSPAMGLNMSCIAVELCIAQVLARQFPKATFAAYSRVDVADGAGWSWLARSPESLPLVNVAGRTRRELAQDIQRYTNAFGGTDCAIPLRMAERDPRIDAVISITDNETGGTEMPTDVIQRIYGQGRTNFRHAVVALALNDISIADPNDVRQMDAVGASADLPKVLARFIQGVTEDEPRTLAPESVENRIDGTTPDTV